MNHRFESALANVILYGAMAAVLIFFYVPIFTLIAFSFQEGRFLTLPFEGVSLKWYGELFRSGPALTALWNSTVIAIVLNGRSESVWVASTCSTSEVPMPIASAPNAPWVEVCESPQTTVVPGCVRPSCGPTT